MKELEINDTPYGLRVMATDYPTNKSVGSCPKDISTKKLNELVALPMKYQTILLKQFFGVKGAINYVAIATVSIFTCEDNM